MCHPNTSSQSVFNSSDFWKRICLQRNEEMGVSASGFLLIEVFLNMRVSPVVPGVALPLPVIQWSGSRSCGGAPAPSTRRGAAAPRPRSPAPPTARRAPPLPPPPPSLRPHVGQGPVASLPRDAFPTICEGFGPMGFVGEEGKVLEAMGGRQWDERRVRC